MWVTALGPVDHAVGVAALAGGRRGGVYVALCGERFSAAAMVAEPDPRCWRCTRYLAAQATLRDADQRLRGLPAGRRVSLVRRFLAAVMPTKQPDDSSRAEPPAGACPPDEPTGRHARRDSDAPPLDPESRRAPHHTASGRCATW